MKIVSLDEVRNKAFCPSVTQEVVEMPPDPEQDIGPITKRISSILPEGGGFMPDWWNWQTRRIQVPLPLRVGSSPTSGTMRPTGCVITAQPTARLVPRLLAELEQSRIMAVERCSVAPSHTTMSVGTSWNEGAVRMQS